MTERWLSIPGYEGLYEVSDLGRVRSVDHVKLIPASRRSAAYLRTHRGRLLARKFDRNGYPIVDLCQDGVVRRFGNHQLVLVAFVGPRPAGMVSRHLNGDRTDPRLVNLAYGTYAENSADMRLHGTVYQLHKTKCPSGHKYAGANLYITPAGARGCRACRRQRAKDRGASRKVAS